MSGIRSVFVLNTGSSSVKFRVVDAQSGSVGAEGLVDRIGEPGSGTPDHRAAIDRILATVPVPELALRERTARSGA